MEKTYSTKAKNTFIVIFMLYIMSFAFYIAMSVMFRADSSRHGEDPARGLTMHYVEKARTIYVTPLEYSELSLLEYNLIGNGALLALLMITHPGLVNFTKAHRRRTTPEEKAWVLGSLCLWSGLLYFAGPMLAACYMARLH